MNWINCNELLPAFTDHVLLSKANGVCEIGCLRNQFYSINEQAECKTAEDNGLKWKIKHGEYLNFHEVLFWMELPKEPLSNKEYIAIRRIKNAKEIEFWENELKKNEES